LFGFSSWDLLHFCKCSFSHWPNPRNLRCHKAVYTHPTGGTKHSLIFHLNVLWSLAITAASKLESFPNPLGGWVFFHYLNDAATNVFSPFKRLTTNRVLLLICVFDFVNFSVPEILNVTLRLLHKLGHILLFFLVLLSCILFLVLDFFLVKITQFPSECNVSREAYLSSSRSFFFIFK
jgi:hypothetical protein